MGKVAFITGGSRGIGKAIGLKLAGEGWDIVVAAKTTEPHPKLEGTIFTAAEEIEQHGTTVLPVRCDVTDLQSINEAVEATMKKFGRVDAVINNAGALWWRNMDDTPMRRFDLVMNVNARGTFAVTSAFLPVLKQQGSGHVIVMSPPISKSMIPGRIAYSISKFGMTMIAFGIAEEFKGAGISATALWPATLVESQATINHEMADPSQWRKGEIMADATFEILQHPERSNGRAVIDEDFLREVGYTDFDRYACVPGATPMEIRLPNVLD